MAYEEYTPPRQVFQVANLEVNPQLVIGRQVRYESFSQSDKTRTCTIEVYVSGYELLPDGSHGKPLAQQNPLFVDYADTIQAVDNRLVDRATGRILFVRYMPDAEGNPTGDAEWQAAIERFRADESVTVMPQYQYLLWLRDKYPVRLMEEIAGYIQQAYA